MAFAARLCVLFVAGWAVSGTGFAQQAREVSIALGAVGFGTAPVPLAQQLGLFERHGLKVRLIAMDSGSDAVTALLARSVDVAMSGAGELVSALGRGQKVVAIASVYQGSAGTLVLAKPVADRLAIPVSAPAQARLRALSGLLIASPSPTSGYTATVKGAMAAAGLGVRLTYMAPTAMASALEAGAIDGYIAAAPSWAPPVVRGTGVAWLSGPKQEFPAENSPIVQGSLQVRADFARDNPGLMRDLAETMADFANAVSQRPADVKAALARHYANLDQATLETLFASEAVAWHARPITPEDIRHDIEFVRSGGVSLPNIDAVDPAAVAFRPGQ